MHKCWRFCGKGQKQPSGDSNVIRVQFLQNSSHLIPQTFITMLNSHACAKLLCPQKTQNATCNINIWEDTPLTSWPLERTTFSQYSWLFYVIIHAAIIKVIHLIKPIISLNWSDQTLVQARPYCISEVTIGFMLLHSTEKVCCSHFAAALDGSALYGLKPRGYRNVIFWAM